MPEWYPWPDAPGLGTWARAQARLMAEHHDVVVLAASPGRVPGWTLVEADEDGLPTLRLRYAEPPVPYAAFPFRLAGSVRALAQLRRGGFDPEVVHAHVFLAGLPSLALSRRAGAALVVSEHWSRLRRGELSILARRTARSVYRRADLVCPASRDLARFIGGLGVGTAIRTVPNSVDTDLFSPSARPRHPGAPRLLTVGGLVPVKGHRLLLEAFERLRFDHGDARLDLVGDGPLRGALERHAGERGLAAAVTFHGQAPPERVAQMMREADVFVIASEFESAPHVLLEAMASGLPSVATDVGGVSEIVDEGSGVLVRPGDPVALAGALNSVLVRRSSFHPQRLAARARERYGRQAVASAWSEVYDEAIARRSTRPRWRYVPGRA